MRRHPLRDAAPWLYTLVSTGRVRDTRHDGGRLSQPARAHDTPSTPLRPPLKWAGGKRWQIPHLRPLWDPHRHRRLVEPFCGGLAVALGLGPRRALLNDTNAHLIHFYQWIKRGLQIDLQMRNQRLAFHQSCTRFNQLLDDGLESSAEAAGLFYYLNRTGYNGLCRFNRQGRFNVPFGRHTRINYVRNFEAYRDAFVGWRFTSRDVEQVLLRPDDFVYADPPYDVPFTQYSKNGFDWDHQVRAATWLARHAGPVILTNQATDRVVELYSRLGFQQTFLLAPRMISCTGERRRAREVMATRNV